MAREGFKLCGGPGEHMKGVHFTFSNGVTVSIQWGRGSYSDNRDDQLATESSNAEIAIWGPDGKWLTRDVWEKNTGEKLNDEVQGWLPPMMVLKVLNWAEAWEVA